MNHLKWYTWTQQVLSDMSLCWASFTATSEFYVFVLVQTIFLCLRKLLNSKGLESKPWKTNIGQVWRALHQKRFQHQLNRFNWCHQSDCWADSAVSFVLLHLLIAVAMSGNPTHIDSVDRGHSSAMVIGTHRDSSPGLIIGTGHRHWSLAIVRNGTSKTRTDKGEKLEINLYPSAVDVYKRFVNHLGDFRQHWVDGQAGIQNHSESLRFEIHPHGCFNMVSYSSCL